MWGDGDILDLVGDERKIDPADVKGTALSALGRGEKIPIGRLDNRLLENSAIKELRGIVGERRVLAAPEELAVFAYDGTFCEERPDVVVVPASVTEVSRVLRFADENRIPVYPRGAGTGLAGGSVPTQGGIALNLAPMNVIREIDLANMVAVVEPGVVTAVLQEAVEKQGAFYPPDPASLKQCTLGGNVAMNAGGPRGLKYGVTNSYVLGLEAVLPGGEVLRLGGKPIKNVTGYSLTQLFVGSEGTFGVVTEITLRLVPLPAARAVALAVFPRLEDAAAIVQTILGTGIVPATIEIMDSTTIACVEAYLHLGLPLDVDALVIIEVDGDPALLLRQLDQVADLCAAHGASSLQKATAPAEIDRLWLARRSVSPSLARLRPHKLGEDISVPRGSIVPMVRALKEIAARHEITIAIYGHISDGNLHPNMLFDRRKPEERERVHRASRDIFAAAVAFGGTLSGEHGIGLLKKECLGMALANEVISAMKRVKAAFDPHGIMNPGKVFP